MKWFKHPANLRRDPLVKQVKRKLGHKGVLAWVFLIETLAERWTYDRSDTRYGQEVKDWLDDIHLHTNSREVFMQLLDLAQSQGRVSYSRDGEYLEIDMPELVDIMDETTRKLRKSSGTDSEQTRTRSEKKRVDEEIENRGRENSDAPPRLENSTVVTSDTAAKDPIVLTADLDFLDTYKKAFSQRYGAEPPLTEKDTAQAKALTKSLGVERAKALIETYLSMNDEWFLTRGHDLHTFLNNLNLVNNKYETGSYTSKGMAKSKAKDEYFREMERRIMRGDV